MSLTRYVSAIGVAGLVLWAAGGTAARAAEESSPPPSTQPSKVLLKLLIATAKPQPDAMPSDPWIAEAAGQAGCPVATDCCGWTELSGQSRKIDAPRLAPQKYEAAARLDVASKMLMIDLTAARKRTLVLLDRIGQRDLIKLEQLPDGRTAFVALEVVPQSVKPAALWGEAVNNVRMHARLEPETWPAKGAIRFVGFFENLGEANIQNPMWAGHLRVPLEITDAKGKAVDCQTTANAKNPGMFFGGMSMLPPHVVRSVNISGDFTDSTLTVVSGSGTIWRWKLPAGEYQVRAVADFQDMPYRGPNQPGGPVVYSQKTRLVVAAPGATTRPEGR